MEPFEKIEYQLIKPVDIGRFIDLRECVNFQFFTSFSNPDFFDSYAFYKSLIDHSFENYSVNIKAGIVITDIYFHANFDDGSYVFFKVDIQ